MAMERNKTLKMEKNKNQQFLEENRDHWLLKNLSKATSIKATMHGITISSIHREDLKQMIDEYDSRRSIADLTLKEDDI